MRTITNARFPGRLSGVDLVDNPRLKTCHAFPDFFSCRASAPAATSHAGPRPLPLLLLLLLLAFGLAAQGPRASAAGVTLITHGHLANATEWVIPMAAALPAHARFPATGSNDFACYQITVVASGSGFTVTPTFLAGSSPTNTASGELFIKLDWSDIANDLVSDSTANIAAAVVPRLLQTNFIAGLGGRALAELPLHFIGHSRGGSLVCEMARLLGLQGVWVDQLTLLDPHPVNNDGFSDPLLPFVTDASARIFENVLYADNYWETINSYPKGKAVAGCYNRLLTSLNGGYTSAHSDVHLWYHATIDWRTPVSDTQASLSAAERQTWWAPAEAGGTNAGYFLSRLARGPRQSDAQPVGPGTGRLVDGFNQRWNLGVAGTNNRAALASNSGLWPSLIQARLTSTNTPGPGQALSLETSFQFARPPASNVTLRLALDRDGNPWNGVAAQLGSFIRPGTTANAIASEMLTVPAPTAGPALPPGTYQVALTLDDGQRRRHLYLPTSITLPPAPPLQLAIEMTTPPGASLTISGTAGGPLVLERSSNLAAWTPFATNLSGSTPWRVLDASAAAPPATFYRARQLP